MSPDRSVDEKASYVLWPGVPSVAPERQGRKEAERWSRRNLNPVSSDRTRVPVIALPVALYASGDLIFELYNGGVPRRLHEVRWEWLAPLGIAEANDRPSASSI